MSTVIESSKMRAEATRKQRRRKAPRGGTGGFGARSFVTSFITLTHCRWPSERKTVPSASFFIRWKLSTTTPTKSERITNDARKTHRMKKITGTR